MFKTKNDMSLAIYSDEFLRGTEIITTLRNKMIFFYLLCERYIITMKAYLTKVKKFGTLYLQTLTRIFSKNF